MKNRLLVAAFVVLAFTAGVSAQAYLTGGASTWFLDSSVGGIASCGTPQTGKWGHCAFGTGEAYSTGIVTAPATTPVWVQFIPAPASTGIQTFNNVAPGPKGNVSCQGGTTPVTPVTFSATSPNLSVPQMTVTAAPCTGS